MHIFAPSIFKQFAVAHNPVQVQRLFFIFLHFVFLYVKAVYL